ncbi:MAG: beta-ketoacyl-[acyl-carrier-protein] synthase family protein, partial [Planctomycetes bacterium]|nr:beta-ketoacyl-[acyl-carrier-protein] synthase family protein [Planctomycetota bacterium]
MKRVVITGCGVVTPLGYGVTEMMEGLYANRSAVQRIDEWEHYDGLRSMLGAPLEMQNERDIPRRSRRTMSPMSIYGAQAAEQAVESAGLDREDVGGNPQLGCIMGHTTGSPITIMETYRLLAAEENFALLGASEFFRTLSHTVTMNVAEYFGIRGVVMATSAACASGLQAIGTGMDLIRQGRQDIMLCGGAEELHETVTGSFDVLYATSTEYNDHPTMSPRPFDRDRDGLVCGEGAGVVLLEDYDHAVERGAKIIAELLGYHTCGSGVHVSQSDRESMVLCMGEALE